eukprot:CAMPEP_0118937012 /NCGR_PEP_ID=MMETSP1169-20130426/21332_1 /TAXON_ID=36882 /ORGANISM="Pyramimonas obovata, Strain CCMP722" /LENGTH=189 /DNA_ID=CAMNT_0006880503 /DNA_START=56 /DNA_END=622 /DNA_ORIENTATION=+
MDVTEAEPREGEELENEILALSSIFGEDFTRVGGNRYRFLIHDDIDVLDPPHRLTGVQIEVLTSSTYPYCPPDLTCRSTEGKAFWQWAKLSVEEHAVTLLGQEMIYDLLEMVKEKLSEWNSKGGDAEHPDANEAPPPARALFLIDHMRSANRYIKLLRQWADELALTGEILTRTNHRNVFVWVEGAGAA